MAGVLDTCLIYRISPHAADLPILSLSFSELLSLTRQFEATDERDRIFGLLGLPNTDCDPEKGELFIDPDYTAPFMEIYKRLAIEVLRRDRNLDFLSSVQHGESFDAEYPSWIPRWDRVYTQIIRPSNVGGKFNACNNTSILLGSGFYRRPVAAVQQSTPDTNLNYSLLKLWGIKVSIVSSFILEVKNMDEVPNNVLKNYSEEFYRDQVNWDTRRLCLTLTAGKDWYGMKIHDSKQHQADFAAALQKYQPAAAAQLKEISVNGNIERFLESADNACRGRKIFSCSTIPLGLGPAAMRRGDILSILYGGSVPFILRREKDFYRLIGECYVYDLMDGTFLRKWKEDDQNETWFDIR